MFFCIFITFLDPNWIDTGLFRHVSDRIDLYQAKLESKKKKNLRWMRVQPCRQQHSVAMRVGGQVYVDQSLLSKPPPPSPGRAGIPY